MELEFTDQNYAAYAAEGKPMVIDFFATWCGPCRKVAPIIETMAEKYGDRVLIGKCDVDESVELAEKFGIRNIPTVLFCKGETFVDKTVGAVPAGDIEKRIEALL